MGERIRCRKCGDILQSKYRHDFKMCRCGSCYIDGGDDYKRWFKDKEVTDIFEYYNGVLNAKKISVDITNFKNISIEEILKKIEEK